MICLIQLLFYEAHDGKRTLECKGKDCMWYGGQDCWAAKRDGKDEAPHKPQSLLEAYMQMMDGKDGNDD